MAQLRQFRILTPCLVFVLAGCVTIPPGLFKVPPDSLQRRQLQMRQYETIDEAKIISACAGALQDLGFTIDESETKLGLIFASKERSAVDGAQVAGATLAVALAALAGTQSNAYELIDKTQKIRISVVTRRSQEGSKTLVRVTFQRMVWNMRGQLSRMETLRDPEMYQGFFERLSKAIFLEEQKI